MKAFRNVTLLSLALAVTLAIAPAAKADYIAIGSSLNVSAGNDNWTATQVNFTNLGAGVVLDSTGDLAVTRLTSVAISSTPLIFGSPTTTPVVFTVVSGGITETFTFEDVYVVTDTSNFLLVSGYGWLTETGYDRTFATFVGSSSGTAFGNTNSSGINFNITSAPAPEPGTLSLFGTGLLGLAGMLRYKFQKN
jgi:hypothetical protein